VTLFPQPSGAADGGARLENITISYACSAEVPDYNYGSFAEADS